MQAPAHLVIGWLTGELAGVAERRNRRIIGLCGIVPDVDSLVYPVAYVGYLGDLDRAFLLYSTIHHRYTHGIAFAALVGMLTYALAVGDRRARVACLSTLAVLIHIGCDVVGAGVAWPVYPLAPFSDITWTVGWSWNVSDWRNVTVTALALTITLTYARMKGYSPLECLSYRADAWMTAVMRGEAQSSPRFRFVVYALLLLACTVVLLPLWIYFW